MSLVRWAGFGIAFGTGVITLALAQLAGVIHVQSPEVSVAPAPGHAPQADAQIALAGSGAQQQEVIEQLQQSLLAAQAERADLAEQLQDVHKQLEELQHDVATKSLAAASSNVSAGSSGAIGETVVNPHRGPAQSRPQQSSAAQFDALVQSGLDSLAAEDITSRVDQFKLGRLELIDQATREGWRDSDQFADRMAALREQRVDIRAELGDEQYDRYLYFSGDNNRVAIADIIGGSAAETAGIMQRDMIWAYAGERIFTLRELQQATREGIRGETVGLTIKRDGQLHSLDIVRGPLGVSLIGLRINPDRQG